MMSNVSEVSDYETVARIYVLRTSVRRLSTDVKGHSCVERADDSGVGSILLGSASVINTSSSRKSIYSMQPLRSLRTGQLAMAAPPSSTNPEEE